MDKKETKPVNYENNKVVYMTRRYPELRRKVLRKDSNISERLIKAWDIEKNKEKVLQIFLKEQNNLSDQRYWELMRTVWIIVGSVENSEIFRKLMKSQRNHRGYFSTPEEGKNLREMPDELIVYRAANSKNDGGLSWTVSKEYAEWYFKEFKKAKIIERYILKSEIFALIERNLESEVIIL